MNIVRLALAVGITGSLIGASGVATAAPVDRTLEITITFEGKQDWRNALQWSKATTTQRYEFSTGLRSDGMLEGANLLDLDRDRRMAIKTEYLRRAGAAKLKAAGIDPNSADLQSQLSARAQKDTFACNGEMNCMGKVAAKYSELMAAAVEPPNPDLFAGEPRYLFFFGYPGCPNRIHAVNQTHAEGETAYGRNKDHIFPYALDLSGDSKGSDSDAATMCSLYTVVVDTKDQKLFVENVYIPSAHGKSTRTEFGKTQTQDADLPIADPLQGWVNQTLRETTLSGTASTILPLTTPLDGNSTVMGTFTGEGKATVTWALTGGPAAAARKP